MATFESSFSKTSAVEGGYANHSADKGGETYHGIARKFWPGWKGWEEVDAMKAAGKTNAAPSAKLKALIREFYDDRYWKPAGCDLIESQTVADELFDTAVNMGVSRAVRFLQESLVVLGEKIKVDGQIGPKTINAANKADAEMLVRLLNLFQGARYVEIVRADPTQNVFLRGWLRRADTSAAKKVE